MQNPWSLNSLGAYAGEKLLQDQEYIRKTRDLILSERDKMCTEISKINMLTVYPAYANFVLVKIEKEGVTSADDQAGSDCEKLLQLQRTGRGILPVLHYGSGR